MMLRSALAFDLLARSARQEGRARKSARSGCLVDCCEQAGVERVCLGRPAHIEDERYRAAPLASASATEEKITLFKTLRAMTPPVNDVDVRTAIQRGRDDEFDE